MLYRSILRKQRGKLCDYTKCQISDSRAVLRIAMLGRRAYLENACIWGDLWPINTLRC